jgi:hypothetical protein
VALHRLKTARSPWLPAVVLLAAVGGGAFVGLQAGMSCMFPTMLTPDWFGSVNHYLGPVNYLIANMGSAGAALPLAMLGLLYGAPRRLALGAGLLFGCGLLAGFNAPGISQLVGALPLFSIAANTRLELFALLATAVLAGLGLDALRRAALPAAAGLRLFLALAAPALGAWLALVAVTRQGLIPDTTVPARLPSDVKLEAGLLPLSTPGLTWPGPEPGGPGKLMLGWLAPTAQPHLVQLLFNQQRDPSRAECVPLHDPDAAGVPPRLDMSRPVYLFRTRLPPDKLPPGPTTVRVWTSVEGGARPEVSELLRATDDPGLDELPFPAQPAAGWLDTHLLLVAAIAVAAAAAAGLAGARWPGLLLVAGTIAGLLLMLGPLLPFLPPELHYPDPPALGLLASARPDGRLLQMIPHRFAAELPTYYGLYDVRGYDALCPLHVAFLLRAATNVPGDYASVDLLPQRTDVDRDLLGLMAVKFLTDWAGAPPELVRRHYPGEDTLPFHDPFPVHENDRYLPRARLVTGAIVVDDDESALAALRSPHFERETMAVIASGAGHGPAAAPAGPARIVVDTPDFLRVEVEPAAPGWLLLADSFYPGWTARVDGRGARHRARQRRLPRRRGAPGRPHRRVQVPAVDLPRRPRAERRRGRRAGARGPALASPARRTDRRRSRSMNREARGDIALARPRQVEPARGVEARADLPRPRRLECCDRPPPRNPAHDRRHALRPGDAGQCGGGAGIPGPADGAPAALGRVALLREPAREPQARAAGAEWARPTTSRATSCSRTSSSPSCSTRSWRTTAASSSGPPASTCPTTSEAAHAGRPTASRTRGGSASRSSGWRPTSASSGCSSCSTAARRSPSRRSTSSRAPSRPRTATRSTSAACPPATCAACGSRSRTSPSATARSTTTPAATACPSCGWRSSACGRPTTRWASGRTTGATRTTCAR